MKYIEFFVAGDRDKYRINTENGLVSVAFPYAPDKWYGYAELDWIKRMADKTSPSASAFAEIYKAAIEALNKKQHPVELY